jgi:pimeloyl-ACP methyl ester carboxylesterase
MTTARAAITHNAAEPLFAEADGIDFAYRRFGSPDPALTDAHAAERKVILVDYPGVGSSTGHPSSTIAETALAREEGTTGS